MVLRTLILTATLCAAIHTGANAQETIKIGAIFSATGAASFLGEPEKNTALMLTEQLNAKGGVNGKKIELVVYDDESDVNKAVLAADKLLKKDGVVAVIGPTTSGATLAVMPKFIEANIPLVSCAAAEKITNPINPWIFKTPQSDRHAVGKILGHAKAKGFKKLAILTVSDGFGQAGREVLKELVPKSGFELVADEIYAPADTDMTAQLTKIGAVKPDAVVVWGTNPGPAVIARNRVQLGQTIPMYMSHGVASKKFIELAGDASEGLMLPVGRLNIVKSVPDAHPQKAVLVQYAKDYEAAFKAPASAFGGYAHDALMLLVEAVKKGGSAKPADIRDNLEKIAGFVGVSGVFTFSPTDHNGLDESAFEMVVIEKGDWKTIN